MKYRRGDRFGLPYTRQSLIHFLCQSYNQLPVRTQAKINGLCREADPVWHQAVFAAVTTEQRLLDVAEFYGGDSLSEASLYRRVERFYQIFNEQAEDCILREGAEDEKRERRI